MQVYTPDYGKSWSNFKDYLKKQRSRAAADKAERADFRAYTNDRIRKYEEDSPSSNKRVKFPKTKVMPKKGKSQAWSSVRANPINAAAGRATMKRKYGKNEKVRSTKKVKVSKGLREKVKKVIAGENAYGAYHVRYGGMIGYIDPGAFAGNFKQNPYFRDPSFTTSLWGGTAFPAGSKVWFSAHHQNSGTGATANLTTGGDRVFAYFTPMKILDAASVLWNQKAPSKDVTLVADNFSLATGISTGTPQVGSSQFPVTGPMEIRVINSFVTWRMKNTSQRSLLVKIYHCVPKLKYCDVGPLTILSGPSESLDTATVLKELVATPLNPGGTLASTLSTHPMFEPNMNPSFASAYKYSLKIINLKPGEECVHSIQGPKNYTLDYNKLHSENETKVGSFFKHTTILPIVSVEVDSVFGSNSASQFTGQYATKTANVNASIVNPISIEVDETYKLSCPQNAGFIKSGTSFGTTQQLNLKTKRVVFANFNTAPAAADTYSFYNEENVGAAIVESITA